MPGMKPPPVWHSASEYHSYEVERRRAELVKKTRQARQKEERSRRNGKELHNDDIPRERNAKVDAVNGSIRKRNEVLSNEYRWRTQPRKMAAAQAAKAREAARRAELESTIGGGTLGGEPLTPGPGGDSLPLLLPTRAQTAEPATIEVETSTVGIPSRPQSSLEVIRTHTRRIKQPQLSTSPLRKSNGAVPTKTTKVTNVTVRAGTASTIVLPARPATVAGRGARLHSSTLHAPSFDESTRFSYTNTMIEDSQRRSILAEVPNLMLERPGELLKPGTAGSVETRPATVHGPLGHVARAVASRGGQWDSANGTPTITATPADPDLEQEKRAAKSPVAAPETAEPSTAASPTDSDPKPDSQKVNRRHKTEVLVAPPQDGTLDVPLALVTSPSLDIGTDDGSEMMEHEDDVANATSGDERPDSSGLGQTNEFKKSDQPARGPHDDPLESQHANDGKEGSVVVVETDLSALFGGGNPKTSPPQERPQTSPQQQGRLSGETSPQQELATFSTSMADGPFRSALSDDDNASVSDSQAASRRRSVLAGGFDQLTSALNTKYSEIQDRRQQRTKSITPAATPGILSPVNTMLTPSDRGRSPSNMLMLTPRGGGSPATMIGTAQAMADYCDYEDADFFDLYEDGLTPQRRDELTKERKERREELAALDKALIRKPTQHKLNKAASNRKLRRENSLSAMWKMDELSDFSDSMSPDNSMSPKSSFAKGSRARTPSKSPKIQRAASATFSIRSGSIVSVDDRSITPDIDSKGSTPNASPDRSQKRKTIAPGVALVGDANSVAAMRSKGAARSPSNMRISGNKNNDVPAMALLIAAQRPNSIVAVQKLETGRRLKIDREWFDGAKNMFGHWDRKRSQIFLREANFTRDLNTTESRETSFRQVLMSKERAARAELQQKSKLDVLRVHSADPTAINPTIRRLREQTGMRAVGSPAKSTRSRSSVSTNQPARLLLQRPSVVSADRSQLSARSYKSDGSRRSSMGGSNRLSRANSLTYNGPDTVDAEVYQELGQDALRRIRNPPPRVTYLETKWRSDAHLLARNLVRQMRKTIAKADAPVDEVTRRAAEDAMFELKEVRNPNTAPRKLLCSVEWWLANLNVQRATAEEIAALAQSSVFLNPPPKRRRQRSMRGFQGERFGRRATAVHASATTAAFRFGKQISDDGVTPQFEPSVAGIVANRALTIEENRQDGKDSGVTPTALLEWRGPPASSLSHTNFYDGSTFNALDGWGRPGNSGAFLPLQGYSFEGHRFANSDFQAFVTDGEDAFRPGSGGSNASFRSSNNVGSGRSEPGRRKSRFLQEMYAQAGNLNLSGAENGSAASDAGSQKANDIQVALPSALLDAKQARGRQSLTVGDDDHMPLMKKPSLSVEYAPGRDGAPRGSELLFEDDDDHPPVRRVNSIDMETSGPIAQKKKNSLITTLAAQQTIPEYTTISHDADDGYGDGNDERSDKALIREAHSGPARNVLRRKSTLLSQSEEKSPQLLSSNPSYASMTSGGNPSASLGREPADDELNKLLLTAGNMDLNDASQHSLSPTGGQEKLGRSATSRSPSPSNDGTRSNEHSTQTDNTRGSFHTQDSGLKGEFSGNLPAPLRVARRRSASEADMAPTSLSRIGSLNADYSKTNPPGGRRLSAPHMGRSLSSDPSFLEFEHVDTINAQIKNLPPWVSPVVTPRRRKKMNFSAVSESRIVSPMNSRAPGGHNTRAQLELAAGFSRSQMDASGRNAMSATIASTTQLGGLRSRQASDDTVEQSPHFSQSQSRGLQSMTPLQEHEADNSLTRELLQEKDERDDTMEASESMHGPGPSRVRTKPNLSTEERSKDSRPTIVGDDEDEGIRSENSRSVEIIDDEDDGETPRPFASHDPDVEAPALLSQRSILKTSSYSYPASPTSPSTKKTRFGTQAYEKAFNEVLNQMQKADDDVSSEEDEVPEILSDEDGFDDDVDEEWVLDADDV